MIHWDGHESIWFDFELICEIEPTKKINYLEVAHLFFPEKNKQKLRTQ